MHHDNISNLREEVLRLSQLQQDVFLALDQQGILEIVADKSNDKQHTTIDKKSAKRAIEVLQGECHKLENMDMVLAIVGTMKAGKSTTINAIVGTEILPNRNTPMTAIPTLIRHSKGTTTPRLKLDNIQPLIDLIANLQARINSPDYKEILEGQSKELKELVQEIQYGMEIKTTAEGSSEIFDFLKSVNDLVRIAPVLGLNFPFDDYKKINELPVIDVEFSHLKELEQTKGRLILLDTPGPNEAKQEQLLPMLQDQLEKASAVLAVMDYTQLGSEADEKIREELAKISTTAKDRIYALVNKFDQKKANSMDEEEVKDHVEKLTSKVDQSIQGEKIPSERIFPVSSIQAYLANRARHEIILNKKLPSVKKHQWVEDFFNEARIDEEDAEDMPRIQRQLDRLWDRSKFSKPLHDVIHVTYQKAALLAVDSAVSKSVGYARDINNFLGGIAQGLETDAQKLKKLIADIQNDLQYIGESELNAKQVIDTNIQKMNKVILEMIGELKRRNQERFSEYFKQGVATEKSILEHRTKLEISQQSLSSSFGKKLRDIALTEITKKPNRKNSLPQEIDIPSDGIINFYDDEKQAEKFTKDIEKWIQSEIQETKVEIETILTKAVQGLEQQYQQDIVKFAEDSLDKFKETLKNSGFSGLKIQLPDQNKLKLNINIAALTSGAVHSDTVERTGHRAADGVLASSKRFFGGLFGKDWGKEEYSYTEQEYKVDMNALEKEVSKHVNQFFDNINTNVESNIKTPIDNSSKDFFNDFKKMVEHIRGDLNKSLDIQSKGQEAKQQLLDKIKLIQQTHFVSKLTEDAEELKKNLEQTKATAQ